MDSGKRRDRDRAQTLHIDSAAVCLLTAHQHWHVTSSSASSTYMAPLLNPEILVFSVLCPWGLEIHTLGCCEFYICYICVLTCSRSGIFQDPIDG